MLPKRVKEDIKYGVTILYNIVLFPFEDATFRRVPLGKVDFESDNRAGLHGSNKCLLIMGQR